MINKSKLWKSVVSVMLYWFFSLLLIFVVYCLKLFIGGPFFLGILYGIVVVKVTYCDTISKTTNAIATGLLSAIFSEILFSYIGEGIISYTFRNKELYQDLIANEVAGYNFGKIIFWVGLLVSLVVSFVIILVVHLDKKSREKQELHKRDRYTNSFF